jgi:hypothetical protein
MHIPNTGGLYAQDVLPEILQETHVDDSIALLRYTATYVLSQYFHCTERIDRLSHAHSWLDAWVDGLDNVAKYKQNGRFDFKAPLYCLMKVSQKRTFANATIQLATMPKCESPCA